MVWLQTVRTRRRRDLIYCEIVAPDLLGQTAKTAVVMIALGRGEVLGSVGAYRGCLSPPRVRPPSSPVLVIIAQGGGRHRCLD